MKNDFKRLKLIEGKIRRSLAYSEWVTRNKAFKCHRCDTTERLQCHHVTLLYSEIAGAWRMYGNEEDTIKHVLNRHRDDYVDCVTLCDKCHQKQHPLGHLAEHSNEPVNTSNFTCFPRTFPSNMKFKFRHWKLETDRGDSLGLVSFQTLMALGWYILNGRLEDRIVDNINIRDFARLIGKAPGTSFGKSFDNAMYELHRINVIDAHHITGNNVEIHFSTDYLDALLFNPWFISIEDVKAEKMCVVALKWWLSFQSNREISMIGLDKLIGHLNIKTKCPMKVAKNIISACKEIDWASVEIKDSEETKNLCTFKIRKRGATPINSLRQIMADSINHGSRK